MSNRRYIIEETTMPSFEGGAGSGEPRLQDYLRVLSRYRRMILFMVVAAVALALVYVVAKSPVYLAEMTLQVEPNAPEYGAVRGVEQIADKKTFYQTQYNIISSRAVAGRVAEQLTPDQAGQLLNSPSWFEGVQGESSPADKLKQHDQLISVIRKNLDVHGKKESQLVGLSYYGPTPELAEQVAALVARSYIEFQNEAKVEVTEQANAWLSDQLDKLRGDLEQSEAALQAYKQEHGLISTNDMQNLSSEKLSGTSEKLLDARAQRMAAQVQFEQAQQARQQGGVSALVSVLDNPVVQQLKLRQTEARRELQSLKTHYGDAAPKVKTAQAALNEVSGRLNTEVGSQVAALEKSYQSALEREERLQQSSQSLNEEVRELNSEGYQLAKLEREVEVNRNLFETFLGRVKETSLASQLTTNNIRIIDQSLASTVPAVPNAPRALGLALVLSVFLGIAFAFIRQNLNQTFQTPRDLESRLSLPGIGVLPRLKGKRGQFLKQVAREPRSPFAEAMGEIRTRLQMSGGDNRPQVIMVTSAIPGEGKSTFSSNLASTYSQLGKTLLLDADLRKPALRKLGRRKGLTDLLAGADALKCIQQDSKDPNLYVLGSGSLNRNPQECLSSPHMDSLFAKLRQFFDTVIVDTAPVLAVSDALILGRHVDGAVIAVKASSTPFDVVSDTVRRLRSASIPIFGVTLSQVDLKALLRDGSYAYGHY